MVDSAAADELVHKIVRDWRTAGLSKSDQALCEYAVKVTKEQHKLSDGDLDLLRSAGFDDVAIHDAVQVVAYFNYITRIADSLGVEMEVEVGPWG